MQTQSSYIQTTSQITDLKILNNNLLYYYDISDGAKILSCEKFEILQNINDIKAKIACISNDAKLFAYINNNTIRIISTQTLKTLNTITLDKEITYLSFDPTSTYLFAGTVEGQVLQYRYNARTNLAIFMQNKKPIRHIALFKTKLLFIDNNLSVIDIYTQKLIEPILNAKLIYATFFDTSNIVSADEFGHIHFICLKKNKSLKKISMPFKKISQILHIPNSNYMIVVGYEEYVVLIDASKMKIASLRFLGFEDKVKSVAINEQKILFVALNNNKIVSKELSDAKHLDELIKQNSIKEAYELIKNNVMLEDTSEHKLLEQCYKDAYKEAALALINKKKYIAQKLLSPYENLDSKKYEIKSLFKDFEQYEYLKELYSEKKFTLCYAMIAKYRALKITPQYKKLEDRYKSALLNAQYYMSLNKPEEAKDILKEYMTVIAKRATIKLLLNENNSYLNRLNIPKEVTKNKALAKLDDNTLKLYSAYDKSDFLICYELLDNNLYLNELEIANLLNKHYQNIIYKCDEYALKGDIQSVQKELGSLILISTRKEKTGSLLRVSFYVKIKLLMNYKTAKQAENMFYSYLDIFGIDEEISRIMQDFEKSYNKLAISEDQNIVKDKHAWFKNGYFN